VQGTAQDEGHNRLALRKLMQRNQQATHDIYGQHKNPPPRKSAQSPSTAASGPSLPQSLRAKPRNHSLQAGASTNQKTQSTKNARKAEFLDLINRFQWNRSLEQGAPND